MNLEEAKEIVKECRNWNAGQTSVRLAFNGTRTAEDDVLDAKRTALRKAWEVIGDT
jgi:hypothetical protein